MQRTRVIHTGLHLQRGLLAGVILFQRVNLTFYERPALRAPIW